MKTLVASALAGLLLSLPMTAVSDPGKDHTPHKNCMPYGCPRFVADAPPTFDGRPKCLPHDCPPPPRCLACRWPR